MFGFLCVDKPCNLSSHTIVTRIRAATGIERVGHAGTLDLLATGVLIICVGAAARLSDYVMHQQKRYLATVRLGQERVGWDGEGRILAEAPIDGITLDHIAAVVERFQGEQDQIPPMHSAIKQDGKKLYKLARRGQEIERLPRRVWMAITLLGYTPPDLRLDVRCSAGTYIRSLAHDIGAALGCGAYLAGLHRTESGAFRDPVAWPELESAMRDGTWPRYLIDERRALPDMPEVTFDESGAADIRHGRKLARPEKGGEGLHRAYAPDGTFLGLVEGVGDVWKPHKVFATSAHKKGENK
jgi:tRNA pseudouridine55 synthase